MVHLMADLHHPLHLGFREDNGGNDIYPALTKDIITLKNHNQGQISLHEIWDFDILQYYLEKNGINIDIFFESIIEKFDSQNKYKRKHIIQDFSLNDLAEKIEEIGSTIVSSYTCNYAYSNVDGSKLFEGEPIISGAYYETNQLRHKIQLREPERKLESLYSEVSWDKNTYDLFVRFILIDESKMNSQNLSKVLEITEENSPRKFVQNFSFNQLIENTKLAFAPWTWIVMLFGLSVLLTILNIFQKSKVIEYAFQVLFFFLGIPVLFLYLSSSYHLPERISVNLLGGLSLILVTLSAISFQNIKKLSVLISSLQILILLAGSFMYLNRFQIELDARQDLYKTWRSIGTQQQQSLSSLPENTKVIGTASSIKSDWQNPYSLFKSLDQRNLTFVLGWHNLSPVWQKGAQNMGLSPDNLFENLRSPNVSWATNKDDFNAIQEYFTLKLDRQITLEDLGPIGYDQYHLYKVQE
jgi:hypothetical protein